jgi:ssDNA-binding Zn-finger/Zn-ribbon topoisomerase 1
MALKTLHQHNEERKAAQETPDERKTGLSCPKCRAELLDIEGGEQAGSPALVKVRCSSCSFTGDRMA